METFQITTTIYSIYSKFLSYLWGMETSASVTTSPVALSSSYPTYEEWKLTNNSTGIIATSDLVLILPMRNGNILSSYLPQALFQGSYPTYEEWKHYCWKHNERNWSHGSYPTYEEWKQIITTCCSNFYWVLILPMRNGNNLPHILTCMCELSSYPTYEEWKLLLFFFSKSKTKDSSYPTYEEWKLMSM